MNKICDCCGRPPKKGVLTRIEAKRLIMDVCDSCLKEVKKMF